VTYYDEEKGFGFIKRAGGPEIYFHYSAIRCEGGECQPEEGDDVEFTVVQGKDGPQAQDVLIVRDSESDL